MIKRILVPLDGSELSRAVLPTIEELALKLGASLVLFHAISPIIATYPGVEMIAVDNSYLEDQQRAAGQFLSKVAAEQSARGLQVTRVIATGSVVDEIVRAAGNSGADMIAMSTHGHSGIGRWVLGSVADAVVRRTHLPCLLLRPAQVTTVEHDPTSQRKQKE